MKITKRSLFFALAIFATASISAQTSRAGEWCAADQNLEEMKLNDPAFAQARQELENYTAAYSANYNSVSAKKTTIIIPVVVHNITHSGGQGYISKAAIDAQINRLNIDFNRLNSDANQTRPLFAPHVGSIDIEFRLAHIDPNGNCTEGIVRMESPLSFNPVPRNAVKSVSYWPHSGGARNYFNIWIIDEIQDNGDGTYVAGYAQFPGSNNNGTYGVVMTNQNIGFSDRSLTHELGHCFNLLHTFNYGVCSGFGTTGDYCSDTPTQDQSYTSQCDLTQNTCSNDGTYYGGDVIDQIENYMSYASCQNMFTLQQEARMMAILNNTNINDGVAHLSTAANLAATGVADPYSPAICVPIADFSSNKEFICQGDSVTFNDDSYNADPTIYAWQFTGGTPSTSSNETPTITYNTPGVFDVTHEPGTTAGSASVTKTDVVTVSSLMADYSGIIVDGFENATNFNNEWRVENLDGSAQEFERTTVAAATGSASVRISNTFITTEGQAHELISPSYDLSVLGNPTINFKRAFARKGASNTDKLLVWYSLDCGYSWFLAMPPLSGAGLSSIGNTFQGGNWAPGANDWVIKTRSLAAITSETNVRFKFAFESGGGNNLYIDDINIDGTLSIKDELTKITSFNVYPNPTSSSARISFNLITGVNNLSINVRNAVGQVVTNVINGESFAAGRYNLKIDEEKKLASGIYFIEMISDGNVKVEKLIVR